MEKIKLYVYNDGTHTLHIHGLCKDAHGSPNDSNYKFFAAENAAVKSEGRSLRMCETCIKERDRILNKLDLEALK